jgi:hypothetical protein
MGPYLLACGRPPNRFQGDHLRSGQRWGNIRSAGGCIEPFANVVQSLGSATTDEALAGLGREGSEPDRESRKF